MYKFRTGSSLEMCNSSFVIEFLLLFSEVIRVVDN